MKRISIQTFLASLTVASILTFIAAGQSQAQPAAEPSGQSASRTAKVVFPLAKAIKQPVSNYALEQLAEMWPAFRHAPIETAGFNHFTLPFLYTSLDGSGDSNEAYAFSFLLSNSLDWVPGGYCSRHAYFTFKRARRYVQKLALKYDENLIKSAIKDWEATHAVGGKLIQSKDGYAGTLEIYDHAGKQVLTKEYKKPREYFDLLGDMSVDAIIFFGGKPTAALVSHLHRRRCQRHQSIIDLGKAAFAEEKTDEEFGLYDQILKRDPGFADVRYWWANQKWWHDRNRPEFEYQMALVMDSYLIEPALRDFYPKHCPDKKLAGKHQQWLRDAEMLVGPDHPTLLYKKLKSACAAQQVPHDLLVRATRVASKYPNDHWFLWELGWAHRHEWGSGDSDLAASIFLVGMRNRYLTSSTDKDYVTERFALTMIDLGHNDIAAQVLLPIFQKKYSKGGASKAGWCAKEVAKCLDIMGRHEEAIKYYRIAFKGLPEGDPEKNKVLVKGAIAAVLAGKDDILRQILRDRRKELTAANMLYLLEAYRDALDGKPVDTKVVAKKLKHKTSWSYQQEAFFYVQMDLLAGKDTQRTLMKTWTNANPNNRSFMILFDAYDRKDPQPESACFYEAIEWLYGNDPWVKKAVADYRLRAKETRILGADELLERLKDFTPIPFPDKDTSRKRLAKKVLDALPPGAVAAAIRKMIANREFAKAEELSLRFHHLGVDHDLWVVSSRATHLVHLVRQAREKAYRLKTVENRSDL